MTHPQLRSLGREESEWLKAVIDLTVRLRVHWTSQDRPDDDDYSEFRGTDTLRLGTGFIFHVGAPIKNRPCHCVKCDGKVRRKFWALGIRTAHHVVYDSHEADTTNIDLFYDDVYSDLDGRMKTQKAIDVRHLNRDGDACVIFCSTHDEILVERIKTLINDVFSLLPPDDLPTLNSRKFDLLKRLMFPSACRRHVLIVSHPHGQPKKLSVGKTLGGMNIPHDGSGDYLEYDAPTCPGSSGAMVLPFWLDRQGFGSLFYSQSIVHSGSYGKPSSILGGQVNYGNVWLSESRHVIQNAGAPHRAGTVPLSILCYELDTFLKYPFTPNYIKSNY